MSVDVWCEWESAQSLWVACRLLIECVETECLLEMCLCLIDERLESLTATVTVVESESCWLVDDEQVVALRATVLHPMSNVNLQEILGQSLCVSECVFRLGRVVEVEERQSIDDGAWDLLAVVEDKVVVACCGYETR